MVLRSSFLVSIYCERRWLQGKKADAIHPFPRFSYKPDQEKIVHSTTNRQSLRYNQDPRARFNGNKLGKMAWRSLAIMRHFFVLRSWFLVDPFSVFEFEALCSNFRVTFSGEHYTNFMPFLCSWFVVLGCTRAVEELKSSKRKSRMSANHSARNRDCLIRVIRSLKTIPTILTNNQGLRTINKCVSQGRRGAETEKNFGLSILHAACE